MGRNVFHWNYGIHVITVKIAVFIHTVSSCEETSILSPPDYHHPTSKTFDTKGFIEKVLSMFTASGTWPGIDNHFSSFNKLL